jgi:hypothetical protein
MMVRIRKTGGFEVETKVEAMRLGAQSFHRAAKRPIDTESQGF